MRWEPFFDDLESQLAAEWAAERAALDTEAERLRVSRLPLRDRLHVLVAGEPVRIDFADADSVAGRVTVVGADWLGLSAESRGTFLIPLLTISSVSLAEAEVIRSARSAVADSARGLTERMPLGFVLRDLARRRVSVRLHLAGTRLVTGTIDRAGGDHLDLAVHDPGEPRRRAAVSGFRLVPLTSVRWIGLDAPIVP